MFGILSRGEPDEDFSWQDQYQVFCYAVRGLRYEAVVATVRELDAVIADNPDVNFQALRREFLGMQQVGQIQTMRLIPVK